MQQHVFRDVAVEVDQFAEHVDDGLHHHRLAIVATGVVDHARPGAEAAIVAQKLDHLDPAASLGEDAARLVRHAQNAARGDFSPGDVEIIRLGFLDGGVPAGEADDRLQVGP